MLIEQGFIHIFIMSKNILSAFIKKIIYTKLSSGLYVIRKVVVLERKYWSDIGEPAGEKDQINHI